MPRLRNIRHERFAVAVAALTPHATAYREAGYGGDEKWHKYNASRLAGLPQVADRIEELVIERERTCAHVNVVHADYIRSKLVPLIETDVRELYEPDPDSPGKVRLRAIESLPAHVTQSISRLKLDAETGKPVEITLVSKTEAAGTLLRSLPGGSIERRELSGPGGGPVLLDALFHPANLQKLDDAEIEMLRLIAHKIAAVDDASGEGHADADLAG
jgi:hypothetical protein